MAIKGVNPSYFAGMPTVALDPKAGKEDPQYAHMLSQAMQNRAAQTERATENDKANAFKARDLDQQARRDRMSNETDKRRSAVLEAGEARLKSGQGFEQDRLKTADTGKLLDALQAAKDAKDDMAVEFFTNELKRRGLEGQETDEDFAKRMPRSAPPGRPQSAPVDRSPMPPRSPPPTASFPPAGEAEATPPMRAAPAGVAPRSTASFPDAGAAGAAPPMRAAPPGAAPAPPPAAPRPPPSDGIPILNKTQDMSWIEGKQPPLSMPPRPMASDNAQFYDDMNWHPPTEKELLDRAIADVVAREAAGQTPTARPLLPGKSLHRRAAESDQMLSPDDPLNRTP